MGRVGSDEAGYGAYLAALTWGRLIVEAVPAVGGVPEAIDSGASGKPGRGRAVRAGFLVHSLLGVGLRQVSCPPGEPCRDRCQRPGSCAYEMLFGPGRPAGSRTPGPLAEAARVPSPCVVQAPWALWRSGEPLRFAVCLLGRAVERAHDVGRALEAALAGGVGQARVRMVPTRCLLERGRFDGVERASVDCRGTAAGPIRIELQTPLRLVRKKRPVQRFCLEELVRDLNFRLAVWGSHYQGLGWAPRWGFLAEDARAARVVADDTRWVSFVRYSSTQGRPIVLGGLLGAVTLDGVTPRLVALLRTAEVMGAGKGATIGLGRVRVGEEWPNERATQRQGRLSRRDHHEGGTK